MERPRYPLRRQCHLAAINDRICFSKSSGKLSDVTIVFPGVKDIKVHRLILGISSPVFEVMLYGPWGERGVITLKEDPPEAFEWMLQYLYNEDTKLPGIVMALQVYRLAHMYQMEEITKVCSEYLAMEVDYDTYPSVFDNALLLEDHALLESCSEVVAAWSEKVLSSRELGGLRRSSLKQLLTHPRLNVTSETFIFRALLHWGMENLDLYHENTSQRTSATRAPAYNSEENPVDKDRQRVQAEGGLKGVVDTKAKGNIYKLKKVIEEFLPLVQFLNMTVEELVTCVVPSGLFTGDECIALIQKSRGIHTSALPSFVSQINPVTRGSVKKTTTLRQPNFITETSLTFTYYERLNLVLLQNFQVNKPLFLVGVATTCVTSFKDGRVNIWNSANDVIGGGIYKNLKCTFKHPVKIMTGQWYTVVLNQRQAWCSKHQSTISLVHKNVSFVGQTDCNGEVVITYVVDSVTGEER